MKMRFPVVLAAATFLLLMLMACSYHPATAEESEPPINTNDAFGTMLNPKRDYLIVVNQDHPYNFDGEYAKSLSEDLVYVVDVVDGDTIGVEKAAYLAFTMLQRHLQTEGMWIGIYDGYRDKETQQAVYDAYSTLEGWCETNTSLKPGFSEHHTGLMINAVIWYGEGTEEGEQWYTETAERQKTIPYFKLFHETLADYGFIDRYPAGKEDVTGVLNEPYEIRFVGSSEVAHAIMDNGLCLEEYLANRDADNEQ